jgi:hypothetical protein
VIDYGNVDFATVILPAWINAYLGRLDLNPCKTTDGIFFPRVTVTSTTSFQPPGRSGFKSLRLA